MNNILINAYQNELTFMEQERNKWKERTKKAVKERNKLQSKIDKAIELIKENKDQVDWLHMPAWELENVLKEDK